MRYWRFVEFRLLFRVVLILVGLSALVAASAILMRDHNLLSVERHDIDARWRQLDEDMKQLAAVVEGSNVPPATMEAKQQLLHAANKQDEMNACDRLRALLPPSDVRVADAEQKIYSDREEYNAAIQRYNLDRELFPKNITATLFHFEREDNYYKSEPSRT
jgi:hypothetical protein